jgi:mycothiol synthase
MLPEGYTSVPTRPDMAAEIAALITLYDTRAGGPQDFNVEDMREIFRERYLDLTKDSLLVAKDEQNVAYAMLWPRAEFTRAIGFGVVHPDHFGRGLGSHLVDFLSARAAEIQAEHGKPLQFHLFAEVGDEAANEIARSRGFERVRENYTMRIEFDGSPIDYEIPDWLTVRTCTPEDSKLCHDLVEETFAEHFGHVPRSVEEWKDGLESREDFDPTLWWLAYDGDEPAGLLLGFLLDAETGWVADLGVRKQYRKRGIASVLLQHAFAEFQRRGMKAAGLGVDAQNETGAVGVYERVGMSVARAYRTFEKNFG